MAKIKQGSPQAAAKDAAQSNDLSSGQARVQPGAENAQATTVRMVRDADLYPKPHTADVHPDEVGNFTKGGWVVATEV